MTKSVDAQDGMQATVSSPGFVGRDREFAVLSHALSQPPAVVLVAGEAGIGKSRLVRELLVPGKHRALVAVCPPLRESLTLGPVVDAIRQVGDRLGGLRLSALAGALRPLFPEWAADLPPAPEPLEDARASRHRLFRALAELIDQLGVEVLVLEDVHWADAATLELLLVLTSRHGVAPPSLLMTYRPEDVPDGSLLLRLSSRLPTGLNRIVLTLEPLDQAGTASLVSSMLEDEPLSEEFARFMHESTDGVPLAVEESVRLMHHKADLVRRDGQWVRRRLANLQVPPTVRDAVLERVHRLSDAARRALHAAAVLTEPADENVIAETAGLATGQSRAGLSEAVAVGLLQEDQRGRLSFRHSLMGRAVYEALPGPERRLLHLAAGNALEAIAPAPVVQLTRHFREANQADKWCQYSEQAAEHAMASDDHTAAVRLLIDVLSNAQLPAGPRARLAHKLAFAAIFRRDAVDALDRQAVQALRIVIDSAELDKRETAEIRGLLGRLLNRLGEFDAAHAEFERAIPDLDESPAEAARYMTNLGLPVGPWPASVHLGWLKRAAQLETKIPLPAERLGLTVDRASALLALGEDAGWAVAAELPASAATMDERRQIARGHFNIGSAALLWGRHAEARQRLMAALELVDTDQYTRLRPHVLVAQAELDWLTGTWAGLPERVAALVAAESLAPNARRVAMLVAGRLYAARGSRRTATDHFRRALDDARQVGAMVDEAVEPAAMLARYHLADDDVGDALQVTDEPIQAISAKRIWIWATPIAPVRVEALAAADRVDEAGHLVAAFARGLRGRHAPAPRAALATCRAILAEAAGDYERATSAFARAARAWDSLPRPYDALLARERQARCLLALGTTDAALDLLSDVRSRLSDLGASADVDRVARLLQQHGVEAKLARRGGRRGYGDRLSPRELEVVRLVVAGRTNRQIAQALSRSPRTVAGQLNSAMRKLKVSSRTAVAVTAVQRGVIDDTAA